MIEVFKTNVPNAEEARKIASELQALFPNSRINFDLEDCDKILRIECLTLCIESVMRLLKINGFSCEVLE